VRLYALSVHNNASKKKAAVAAPAPRRHKPRAARKKLVFRRAQVIDALQICALVNDFAAEKALLPRATEQIALELDNYIVAVDAGGRVLACAALDEYSPSVAEIASVAVARSQQGKGLGSRVVAAAERVALQRGFAEVFAMSLAARFFESMGYELGDLEGFPEKQRRYERLSSTGLEIVPKPCFRKRLAP
jgi:amino-acid N-acetyltransferase